MRAIIVIVCLTSNARAPRPTPRAADVHDIEFKKQVIDDRSSSRTFHAARSPQVRSSQVAFPHQVAPFKRSDTRTLKHLTLCVSRATSKEDKIREAFDFFDADGNGSIDDSELKAAMHMLGHQLTDTDIKHMMSHADVDRSGTIEFSEFLQALTRTGPIRAPKRPTLYDDPYSSALESYWKELEKSLLFIPEYGSLATFPEISSAPSAPEKNLEEMDRASKALDIGRGAIAALLASFSLRYLPHAAAGYSAFAMASPYMCSIITSSVKGVISDLFAQLVVEKKVRPSRRRTLAFTMFGAAYLGAYCQWKYIFLYTALFGSAKTATVIAMKMAVDMLISAPFVYFPVYYFFKGAFFERPLREVRSYFTPEGFKMLKRYWAVWVPTTLVMWTCVPGHLRVPFLCAVSLVWQVLLSTRTYAKKAPAESRPVLGQRGTSLDVMAPKIFQAKRDGNESRIVDRLHLS